MTECFRNLLPVVVENDVEKFKEYLNNEKTTWIKQFILYLSSAFGNIQFLQVLGNQGFEFQGTSVEGGESALNFAAGNGMHLLTFLSYLVPGSTECLKWMIDNGADVKFRKDNGESCLHYAAHNGHKECLEMILDAGGDLNAFTRYYARFRYID